MSRAETSEARLNADSCTATAEEARCRARLERHPDDWQAALALKAALAGLGRYAEGDSLFQHARRHFPDAPWVAHMASLYAFPQGELPALTARARALAQASPGDEALQRLLGDMLLQARDYAGAATAYAAIPGEAAAAWAARASHAETLRRQLHHAPPHGPAPSIAVINLDRNTERLAELDRQFRTSQPPRFRVAGIEGGRLSVPAIGRLGGDPALPGTLGCFLAHAAAWEAMLSRGLAHCLVVEDDVIPLYDLPARWGAFGLPDGFDLCFVNDRLAPPCTGADFRAVPLAEAMRAFPPWARAPGADGYLLSATGAARLLDWVARDGFGGDVDWRLLAYGLTVAQCLGLAADSQAHASLRRLPPPTAPDRLAAFVLTPPLIRTVPLASDREDENRAHFPSPPASG